MLGKGKDLSINVFLKPNFTGFKKNIAHIFLEKGVSNNKLRDQVYKTLQEVGFKQIIISVGNGEGIVIDKPPVK